MYHEFMNRDPIPEIRAIRPHAKDSIWLCDASGLAAKMRDLGGHTLASRIQEGDPSLVRKADEFLRRLEDEQFLSRAWAMQSDVVGSLPNVPAYLAGQPMNMRRRVRMKKPQGPLVLFLETTGSGSTMQGNDPVLRGSAMLALVRVLSTQRAIELYVCTTYGRTNTMNAVLCKVETQPMDLARACWMLVNISSMSHVGFELIKSRRADRDPGSWSYGTPDLERRYCGEIFKRFLTPDSDLLYVPAAFGGDTSVHDAHGWLKRMLKKYGGDAVVREDDEEEADTGFVESA